MIKNIFRAFPRLRQGRALARQSSALLACGLLATIPNAFLSCKGKDTTNNSGLQAASAAKNTEAVADMNTGSQPLVSPGSNTGNTKVDLDLTKMSATMIYSTIFDMLIMPEDYVEKNIKVKGWFQTYTDPYSGEIYYAVVVPDATACCQQGLEFVWPGEHSYPADFPNTGDDITITGLYKVTETDGISYNYLEATSVDF